MTNPHDHAQGWQAWETQPESPGGAGIMTAMTRSATPTPAPLVTRGALQAFTLRLVEQFAPEEVILFGSLARG